MNPLVIEATYQNGVLKLDRPLPLNDNERVRITVESATSWASARTESLSGAVTPRRWNDSPRIRNSPFPCRRMNHDA